ncbi:MAG TPA: hypothetical protein VK631_09865 [Solirubrobacteraceae bacterium]|nr:hypothetical protein [Solirubrobacteraceae bacterium]
MEPRRRAPQRAGHRTTLRVPDDLARAAQELAGELGTTSNDAIIRLAEEGAVALERRRRAAQIASERRDAVARTELVDGLELPTPEELRAAMLSGRHEP